MKYYLKNSLAIFSVFLLSLSSVYSQEWDVSSIEWQEVVYGAEEMPSSIKVYNCDAIISSSAGSKRKLQAWYAEVDVSDENLVFDSTIPPNTSNITTTAHAKNSDTHCYLAINGGYFGSGFSYSLVMSEGVELAENVRALNRNGKGYWVTRGAFGIDAERNMEMKWTFSDPSIATPWTYDIPSPNNRNEDPQAKPSAEFPEASTPWTTQEAIGGAPVLIKSGEIITDYEPELLQDGFDISAAPRTAIGYTADNKMILFVVDGRTAASGGVDLITLAKILKDIGCENALNLDGGGSSTFVANYSVLNNPSDSYERPVYSAFLIKDKTKEPLSNDEFEPTISKVYPNPILDDITIESKDLKYIKLILSDGRTIDLSNLINDSDLNKIDDNLIPKGISILSLESKNGVKEFIKLIKH